MIKILGDRNSGAILDETETYRYSLWREWDPNNSDRVTFIMLNPSTADHEEDDMTIKKCLGFAKNLGAGSLEVVNLFAYRATDPADLKRAGEPVGAENDRYILEALERSTIIIAAWGNHGVYRKRNREVLSLLRGYSVYSLKITKEGHPSHPLYIPYVSNVLPFNIQVSNLTS